MDLNTVKSRLENNFYPDLATCCQDISQVWTNAKIYNSPEHTIHKWAVELGLITNGWVAKLPKTVKQPVVRAEPMRKVEQKETSDQDKSNLINLKVCENIVCDSCFE